MKIIFLGTPEIAKVCLEEILKSKHQVVAVVTKPDKPSGRGNKIQMSPVKVFALEQGIPVYQFKNINQEGVEILKSLKPDVLVLVAFGQILGDKILNIALPINLHGSLLPKYRGPSPIQTAILKGEKLSGVSVIKMAGEVDAGDILIQKKLNIDDDDTSGTLFNKMAILGGQALVESLDLIESGKDVFVSQEHKDATFTTMLTKENAKLDFNEKTANIVNKIRAYNPSPVAFFELDGVKYKVFKARKIELGKEFSQGFNQEFNQVFKHKIMQEVNQNFKQEIMQEFKQNFKQEIMQGVNQDFNQEIVQNFENKKFKNGEIVVSSSKDGLIIKTSDGFVEILEIQQPNGNKLTAKQFLNGKSFKVGTILF